MRLTDADRAAMLAIIRMEFGEDRTDLHGISGYDTALYLAGLAAGRLRGLEEAAKECAMIKTMASTDAADRHWIAGVAYCIDAIRGLASGTGAKG